MTRPKYAVPLALFAIYVLWGSSYLAIRFAIESLPPLFMAGARFTLAGTLLYGYLRLRGEKAPALKQWPHAALSGFLMLCLGNGSIVLAERHVPSGVAALVIATEPLCVALLAFFFSGLRLRGKTMAGLVFGFAGVVVLALSRDVGHGDSIRLFDASLLVVSVFGWAFGSLYTQAPGFRGSPFVKSAMSMLCGGFCMLTLSALTGELAQAHFGLVTAKSIVALIHLTMFCSLGAFSAYLWLIKNTNIALASTAAYVNPVIALLLGWWLAGEKITTSILVAALAIVLGVFLAIWDSLEKK